jgi:transposase
LEGLEKLSEQGVIDLWYGDAARVSVQAYVPYGWQFVDEDVFMPSSQDPGLNCFAFLKRDNDCQFRTTRQTINSAFVYEQLEEMSLGLKKLTVLVLDNASVHVAKLIREHRGVWEQRGLYLFYLPRYSPHFNIVEILWRKLKYEWLSARDYETTEGLFYSVRQALTAVGKSLKINFSNFSLA